MSKSKNTSIYINQEERQLVFHSEFINKYPQLKKILNNKTKVLKKDLIDIKSMDKELYNLIKYNFKNIFQESLKEWYCLKYDGEDKRKCALCNTPNKHIFLIKNRINDNILNVGSECIKKFPGMTSINGISIDKIKKDAVQKADIMHRINKFNDKYPDILDIFKLWREYYNNLPIVMPRKIHDEFMELLDNSRNFYNKYISGKIPKKQLDDFSRYIFNYDNITIRINDIIKLNKNHEFICTKSIKDWLVNNNLNRIVEVIIDEDGYITQKSILHICYFPFVKKYIEKFENIFDNLNFKLEDFNRNEVIISHKFINMYKVYFSIRLKKIMNEYSKIIFEEGSDYITVSNIIKNFDVVKSVENYDNIVNIINSKIDKKKYYMTIDLERNQLEIEDRNNKKYCLLKEEIFFKLSIEKLLLKNESSIGIIELIEKITSWKDISDKEKYNIDEIDKIMRQA